MLVKLDADLSVMFGTQLFLRKQFLDPATNAGLEKAVRARMAAQPGGKVSNVGGWQSQPDLFDWPEPEVVKFGAELDSAVQQLVSFGQSAPVRMNLRRAGWANVNRAGDYNSLHNHPQQHLAAVYYVNAPAVGGQGAPDGLLELRDPRPAAGFNGHTTLFSAYPVRLAPEPGMLVMFPAFVDHMVHPHHGPDERISLAINIQFADYSS
jgi:uncharacterized protein (TIGR02466 family)